MPGVTKEQIARAKEIGIKEYILSHEPDNVKRIGSAYYLRDHESLEISNGLFNWHSRNIGGKNCIDYLIFVRGYSFVDAVRHLAGEDYGLSVLPKARPPNSSEKTSLSLGTAQAPRLARFVAPPLPNESPIHREPLPAQQKPQERSRLVLPQRNKDNMRVIAYLRSRGIDRPLILDCIERGILYETAEWHNACFVGRDDDGKARFAALRGTSGNFKRDAEGSDKRYGFSLPHSGDASSVAVYESPIDLLSHAVIDPDFKGRRLSLGCTALAALRNFLERHGEVKTVIACTDNDEAGDLAASKISELPGIEAVRSIPSGGEKDWNDALREMRRRERSPGREKGGEVCL
jgi:hypothetical protein